MKGDFSRLTFRSENQYTGVQLQQGRVLLDADWNEQVAIGVHRDAITTRDVVGPCGAPIGNAGFRVIDAAGIDALSDEERGVVEEGELLPLPEGDFLFSPGRIYVDGLLCENGAFSSFLRQPHLPDVEAPGEEGALFLAYLDVWERHLTALERPAMREPALGGPDSATRTQLVWQVKLERVEGDEARCDDFGPGWAPSGSRSTGRLRARVAESEETLDSNCLPTPGGGYRGLENQLYRIEIHKGSDSEEGATFKWSRENGSVVTTLTAMNPAGSELVLTDGGRDDVHGFARAAWIEIRDEDRVLAREPGVLLEVDSVQDRTVDITDWPAGLSEDDFDEQITARRWEGTGTVEIDSWIPLENGVEIQFAEGEYRTGDHWMVPARALEGRILWPRQGEGAAWEERHGTEHHFCPLALLRFGDGEWSVESDCRKLFPPLTELPETGVEREPGIHITEVRGRDSDNRIISLRNDTEVTADVLARGLEIQCDGFIDENTVIGKPTCFVTLDLPYPFAPEEQRLWVSGRLVQAVPVIGFQPLRLDAEPSADDDEIFWFPTEATADWLRGRLFPVMAQLQRGDRLLARLTLKGNFIWGRDDPSRYLDGDSFGMRLPQRENTDLALDNGSGDGRRGGDFEMWFWLVPPEAQGVQPVSMTLDPPRVIVGVSSTATVTLNAPVPENDELVLSLSSSDPAIAAPTVPTATVSAGQSRTQFVVVGNAPGEADIRATGAGVTRSARLLVITGQERDTLRVRRVRIRRTDENPQVLGVLENPDEPIRVSASERPTAVEIQFIGLQVDIGTVIANRTFVVRNQRTGELMPGALVHPSPDTVQFVPELRTRLFESGTYTVMLVGAGPTAIRAVDGSLLDGEPVGLPSGTGEGGGNFEFTFVVEG